VRGHVYYFGGGHSTYQVTDVAIYSVGANKWSFAAGDHNDFLPPTSWAGCAMGFRGGKWAHHQRNQYVALDGRMFVSVSDPWFYDLDRGGVWRQRKLSSRKKDKESPFNGPGGTELAEYIEGQDAVWCVLRNRNMKKRTEYWVYWFKRNAWTCMTEEGASIGGPYGQAAYVARYGVLVAVPKRTRVMRVDVEKLKWE